MHELSLAEALLEQVRQHVPPGATVRAVEVQAGAGQALEPEAMHFAWQALTRGTDLDGAELELTILPWTLQCPQCGRQWESDEPLDLCECGQPAVVAGGSHQLTLLSLEIDEPPTDGSPEPAGESTDVTGSQRVR